MVPATSARTAEAHRAAAKNTPYLATIPEACLSITLSGQALTFELKAHVAGQRGVGPAVEGSGTGGLSL